MFYHAIEAQFVDVQGYPFYEPMILSDFTPPMRDNPAAAYNSAAYEFLVIWDYLAGDADHNNYGRRVSDSGAALETEMPIDTSTMDDTRPDLVYNPITGEYLAVWEPLQVDQSDIYAQRLCGAGQPITGGDFYIADETIDEAGVSVAVDSNTGDYLVGR